MALTYNNICDLLTSLCPWNRKKAFYCILLLLILQSIAIRKYATDHIISGNVSAYNNVCFFCS